jgi:hypothetical protein
MQNHDYFNAITKQLAEGGLAAMLHDLLREDIREFNPRKFPATGALADQKLRSLDGVQKWWFQKLQDGHVLPKQEGWVTEIPRKVLLANCNSSMPRSCSAQSLQKQLAEMMPKGYPKEGPRRSGDEGRERTWIIPDLTRCRAHFAKMFRLAEPWPDETL